MLNIIVALLCWIILLPLVVPQGKIRYYACYVSFTVFILSVSPFFVIAFLFRPRNTKNISWCAFLRHPLSKILGMKWQVTNEDLIKDIGKAVVVVNHQSVIDTLAAIYLMKSLKNFTAVARKEVYDVQPFGWAAWLAGLIFIDREARALAYVDLVNQVNKLWKKTDTKIFIFPEGTRNKFGESLLTFKQGAFKLAIATQVPIIPVVVSPYYFIQKDTYFGDGKMTISIMKPISTTGLTLDDAAALTSSTRHLMDKEYYKLKCEIENVK